MKIQDTWTINTHNVPTMSHNCTMLVYKHRADFKTIAYIILINLWLYNANLTLRETQCRKLGTHTLCLKIAYFTIPKFLAYYE